MGERKVLNKYFPPDFDPSKVPKGKRVRSEEKQMKVRMMLPMSVRCNTCGNFMYKGTKFNTRMEDVKGETYLGIKIFRFYYKCTNCSAEFCMKTDPQSADYIVEAGATRNYEPRKDLEKSAAQAAAEREEEEKGNAMKALENRTLDSKREMDILTALDEMRSLKARHETIDTDAALAALRRASETEEPVDLDAEDEEAVRQMLLQRAGFVQRLSDSDNDDDGGGGGKEEEASVSVGMKTSIGSGRAVKRSRGPGGVSVAAAAWEEEEMDGSAEEEEQNGDGRNDRNGGAGPSSSNGGAAELDASRITSRSMPPPPSTTNRNGKHGGINNASSFAPKPSEIAPPSVPSFAKRPAAVVVKRKEAQPKPPAVEKESSSPDGDGNGGGLLGLADYGSSDSE